MLYHVQTKGTLGASIEVTPSPAGEKILNELLIQAPLALPDATLKIYKDSVSDDNILFDGYMMNRDADGRIELPNATVCTSKWIVSVSGSTDDVFIIAKYR